MKHERITVNKNVMFGKPCIAGTRFPVEQILRDLGDGMTPAQIVDAYEVLTPEDVRAAQTYAADVISMEVIEYAHAAS